MLWYTPLPPLLYEIINCALFAATTTWLAICLRYLASAYHQFRAEGYLSRWEAFIQLRSHRMAIGLTIFLCGESPRMGYVWLARYLLNTNHDATWLSVGFASYWPPVTSMVAVIGIACSVRAIIPKVWGDFGYVGTLAVVLFSILITLVIR